MGRFKQYMSARRSSNSRALVPVEEAPEGRIIPANGGTMYPDGFDKREWLATLKTIKKEVMLEDRDRFRPLLKLKKEPAIKEFMEEIERLEKKDEIGLMRERTQIKEFVQRQGQDVDCARSMIMQSKSEPSYLDRIQSKCQMIEQNMKNFKLKSRSTYQ